MALAAVEIILEEETELLMEEERVALMEYYIIDAELAEMAPYAENVGLSRLELKTKFALYGKARYQLPSFCH